MKDELAARRAAKGIFTITIGGKVKHVELAPDLTVDPLETLRKRHRKPRLKPVQRST